ncbi:MAG: DMT family transporter [Dehalococcoidales bacterium]|nr:DMT family transporter [Dehalococcoidales bacterium]
MTKRYLVLALGVISVAFAAIFIRLAEAPSIVIAAYRLGIASLLLAPIVLIRSRKELRGLSHSELLLAFCSGAFLALHFALWITSLRYTTVTSSVVLVTVSPIFVAIASYLLFREKITRRILSGIAISIIGAVIIGFNSWQLGGASVKGSILALLGALAIAGYLLIGRKLRQRMGLLSYIFLTYASAAVILLVWSLIVGGSLTGYSGKTYLMFVLLALVPQLLGHSSFNWSLRFLPATMVTIAVLGEPVGATILAFAILNEVPSAFEIIGGVLILGGIAIAFSKGVSDKIQ